jgi:hypothetical protein
VHLSWAAGGWGAPPAPTIKAFCVDFNWGPGYVNGFAPPGMFVAATPHEHLEWYKQLGVNTIQTFCVSCCGYAWFRSDVAPVQPGMKGDFLKELTALAHRDGLRVMGYFCVGANTHWGSTRRELSHGTPSEPHIPLTSEYLDYLCRTIEDALKKTEIDGFMIDWVWNPPPRWIDCEQKLYAELFGKPFPGESKLTPADVAEYGRRAVDRAWTRIHQTAKTTKPGCILWLSCNDLKHPQVADSKMLREIDWLMNEHFDAAYLDAARKTKGPRTRIIQCVCGWDEQHNAQALIQALKGADVGFYGFARPDQVTTLPPTGNGANARNIESMRRFFHEKQVGLRLQFTRPVARELVSAGNDQ